MGYQPLEKLLPRSGNSIYKLVRLASHRATELAEGKPKLIESPLETKATTIALEEILQGRVVAKEAVNHIKNKKKDEKDAPDNKEAEVNAA